MGSNEAVFGIIEALRKVFKGKIVLLPFKKSGLLENKSLLSKRIEPLDKEDVQLTDADFFERMFVEVNSSKIMGVDLPSRRIHF